MKELLLFRIFSLFPFIGIAAPDLANALHTSFASVPKEHIIVDTTLCIALIVCSAGIWMLDALNLKTQEKNNTDFQALVTREA